MRKICHINRVLLGLHGVPDFCVTAVSNKYLRARPTFLLYPATVTAPSRSIDPISSPGRFNEMSVVLERITNRPVHLPPEVLGEPRTVCGANLGIVAHWRRCWGDGSSYTRVRGVSGHDVSSDDIQGGGYEHGEDRLSKAGLFRLVWSGKDRRLLRVTVTLLVVWFTLSYGSYGVATWNNVLFADIGLSNPYLCSFIFSVASLPGNLTSIFMVERVSSRNSYSSSESESCRMGAEFDGIYISK